MTILRYAAALSSALALGGLALGQGASDADLNKSPDAFDQHVVKILRTSNKAQINRYVPKVYDFKNVNPYEVLRFVRRVMEVEEGAWFVFAAPDMKSGKILVSCPEYQIDGLDKLMAAIDREGLTSSTGTKRIFYRLKHRDAFDADYQGLAALEGTPTVVLIPDDQTNGWLVEDAPSGIERIVEGVTNDYDLPTPQLEAFVTIYEVDINDDGQIGLDYVSWKNGPGRNLFALGAFAQKEKISTFGSDYAASPLIYDSGKGTFGLPASEFESTGRNAAYFYDVPSAYFDYLVTKGVARILTKSKLVALNRSTASLEIGEEILYYRAKHQADTRAGSRLQPLDPFGDNEPATDGSTVAGEPAVIDYPDNRVVVPTLTDRELGAVDSGFFLQFTPTINQIGATVVLFMSLVNHTGYSDDGTPVLASRVIDTILKIPHDGRTINIGGMTRKRRADGVNKMPWLGDLPILGYLFGGESRLDQETMVVVTLSARVVEFGKPNVTEEDEAIKGRADGTFNVKTENNEPGFLKK